MKSRALFFTCIAYSFSPLHEITDIFRHLMKCLTSRIACYMYVCMYVCIYLYIYISLSSDILRQISRHSKSRFPVTILLPQASLSGTLPAVQLSFFGTIRFPIPFRHANHRFPYHSGVTILAFQQALEFEFAEFENPSLYSKHRFPAPSFPL